jgi:hypothetical protein
MRPAMSADAERKSETAMRAKALTPAAERALAEAEARRKAQLEHEQALAAAREVNGRGGKDPVRYNDWEIKGLTSDF